MARLGEPLLRSVVTNVGVRMSAYLTAISVLDGGKTGT